MTAEADPYHGERGRANICVCVVGFEHRGIPQRHAGRASAFSKIARRTFQIVADTPPAFSTRFAAPPKPVSEITKISSGFPFTFYQRGEVRAHPVQPSDSPMKSHSSSRRSPECIDAWRSSAQKSEGPSGRTPRPASRFAPSFSWSAANAAPKGHRPPRPHSGISFHFLVLLSLSCCALFGIHACPDDCEEGDEFA